MMQLPHVLLCSNSPRRKELIEQLGLPYEIVQNDVDETYSPTINRDQVPVFLAQKKNKLSKVKLKKGQVLITADTIVLRNDDTILEKPKSVTDAFNMIKSLESSDHKVITGVCVRNSNKSRNFKVVTKVYFDNISDDEIKSYINTYKPFDKAGSYGIQEWIGLIGIEKIEGSYTNAVGLPTKELYQLLKNEFSS